MYAFYAYNFYLTFTLPYPLSAGGEGTHGGRGGGGDSPPHPEPFLTGNVNTTCRTRQVLNVDYTSRRLEIEGGIGLVSLREL